LLVFSALAFAKGSSTEHSAFSILPSPAMWNSAAPRTAADDPCSGGGCTITVTFDDATGRGLAESAPTYRVYAGCPKLNGIMRVGNAGALQTATTLVKSDDPIIDIPSTLKGNIVTASLWLSTTPTRYVVVDFSKSKNAVVNFGLRWGGTALQADPEQTDKNQQNERKLCPL
jgi:hypothetical protein